MSKTKIKPQKAKKGKPSKQAPMTEREQRLIIGFNNHTRLLEEISARQICMEKLLIENIPGLDSGIFALMIAKTLDHSRGLAEGELVRKGDSVRFRYQVLNSKTPMTPQLCMIEDLGEGRSFPVFFEEFLIGMKVGETRDVTYNDPDSGDEIVAKISIDTVSFVPEMSEKAEEKNEAN